ncbi:hypothetical protein Q8F55_004783 [Vanrija albida]|uniref:SCP domain-containing protein n=1 Tax=Vanrija albida TaxID=181172 RepID=A0ABR3Q0E9_9TREE
MKFSPLVLLALATVVSAAPNKCRPNKTSSAGAGAGTGAPTANGAVSSDVTGTPTGSPSAGSSASPAPVSTGTGSSNSSYVPGKTKDEEWFLDPSVTPTLPPPIGKEVEVTEVIIPDGSVGLNPDGEIPADDPIAEIFLMRFNQWRSVWGAPPLVWNATLAGIAVQHAHKCVYQHWAAEGGGGGSAQVLDTMGDRRGGKGVDLAFQAKRSVDRWLLEGREWNYDTHAANPGKEVGHWHISTDPLNTQIGCGWRDCGVVYCDFHKDWTKIFSESVPEYKEHVRPRIEIPWDDYKDHFWQRK